MQTKLSALAGAVLLTFMASGCSLMLTDYKRPELNEISGYVYAEDYTRTRLDENFYTRFEDPLLDKLIEKALSVNYDMQTAFLNVQRASYALGLSRNNLLPDFTANTNFNLSRELDGGEPSTRSSSANLGLSYEVDLFSRLEAQRGASAEELKATAYDYLAMRLSVIGEVSSAYWQYCYAKEALALGEAEYQDAQRRLELVYSMYQAGAADRLEYDTAHVNFLNVKDTLDARRQAVGNARNALNYLLGQNSEGELDILSLEDAASPEIGLEVPALLLSRRPDLMAAEARLRAAYYDADEARLAYYPTFTLSASLQGGDAASFGRFLSDPVGALGAAITFPFVNYADLRYEERMSLVDRDLAQLNFVDSYLKAVREIYDALENVNYYKQAVVTNEQTLTLTRANKDRYEERYRLGSASLNDFLDACDAERSAAITYLTSKMNYLNAQMTVMTALGGGTDEKSLAKLEEGLSRALEEREKEI